MPIPENDCLIPAKADVYFSFLYNVHQRKGSEVYFDVTESITNFNNYVVSISSLGFDGLSQVTINPNIQPSICIDKKSSFIKSSDPIFEKFKDELLLKYIDHFESLFKVKFNLIKQFI